MIGVPGGCYWPCAYWEQVGVRMNNVELRWVKERVSPSHSSMTLQYRVYKDHGGPYPNYAWSEWMTVPTIDTEKDNS